MASRKKAPAHNAPEPAAVERKIGRPRKIGPPEMQLCVEFLELGMSRKDCARKLAIDYRTFARTVKREPAFAHRLREAELEGKRFHLDVLKKSKDWRASAFYLERKYPKEFARTELHKVKHGGTIKTQDVEHAARERIYKDPAARKLALALARRMAIIPGDAGESDN